MPTKLEYMQRPRCRLIQIEYFFSDRQDKIL